MLNNAIDGITPAYKKSVFSHIPFKQLALVFSVLSLIFCFVPEITHTQKKSLIKQDLFLAVFPSEEQGWACGRWGTVLHTGMAERAGFNRKAAQITP